MDEFKDAKSLYDEHRKNGKHQEWELPLPEAPKPVPSRHGMRRPKESSQEICEQWAPEGCKASQDAFRLGLAKTIFPCQGLVPPYCTIRAQLASGMTVQEIYEKMINRSSVMGVKA